MADDVDVKAMPIVPLDSMGQLPSRQQLKVLTSWMLLSRSLQRTERKTMFISKESKKHEKALHSLANALLEYETLSAEDIKHILPPYQEEAQLMEHQEEQ